VRRAPRRDNRSVYYAAELLDGLRVFAHDQNLASEERFEEETARLDAALEQAPAGSASNSAIQRALDAVAQDRVDSQVAATATLEYYYTAKAVLGSQSTIPDCSFVACGDHADCVPADAGVRCQCKPCYIGDGFTCRPVPCAPRTLGSAAPVRGPLPAAYPVVRRQAPGQVGEVQLAVFGQDSEPQLAVVFRDISNGNRASLVIGRLNDMEVDFGNWHPLSTSAAFGLSIAGFPNGRLLLSFRIGLLMNSTSYVMGGVVNRSGDLTARLSAPRPLARGQVESLVMVPLSRSRAVCLHGEGETGRPRGAPRSGGTAQLVEVLPDAVTRVIGRYRFAEGWRVERISATALSPTSLVAAYRAQRCDDPASPESAVSHELAAQWIGMARDGLLIDPHPAGLETERTHMLARDVALVAQDTFAYSYESQREGVAKVAVVHVNNVSHRMTVTGGPEVIARGAVRFLHSVSLPAGAASPMTLTMFQRPQESCFAEVCRVSPEGRLAGCRDIAWADQEIQELSVGRLPDARLAVAYVSMRGTLLYQLLTPLETDAIPG